MLKQLTLLGAVVAASAATVVPATPAAAQGYYNRGDYYRDYDRGDRYYRGDRYRGDRARNYRGNRYDNRYCRRSDGTTGTIIGAIAGGLLGREVVGRRGDRTAGAIVGAGAGALAGRAIDRSGSRC
ncbi:hypothetical protein GGR88_002065 [Sphingomonas jejuensis]|uniref:17 kDa surface antigen n=1 Tax=Sphingomonas jejuensis TaxID=904715 RepID=A0ABX0XPD8_9SPHN|nr:glycine zipper 2TM domain-containing protein [Sphingomonas jejuensis]NJC34551.1 hypothetical protein [Sphingomonas jejuensis]